MQSISGASFRKKLGARIRKIRQAENVTQKQLAFESELTREEIYRLELGQKNVTVETLLKIASALDVHVKDFLDFDY